MDIGIRDVEKTIRKRAGSDFTGKVVVRFIEGKIIACDVGSPRQPIPSPTPSEMMKRVMPQTGPTWRTYQTDEERAELDAAEQAVADARKLVAERDTAWAVAERRWQNAQRGAYIATDQARARGQNAEVDQDEIYKLRAASDAANRAWMEARDLESQARIEQSRIHRNIWTRCRRRMERDQETPDERTAREKPSLRDRLKSAAGRS